MMQMHCPPSVFVIPASAPTRRAGVQRHEIPVRLDSRSALRLAGMTTLAGGGG